MLYLRNRSSGEHIGDERPAVLRLKVIRLRKGGFVHVEDPIKFISLVPFVFESVYFIIRRRSSKVELRKLGCETQLSK